MNLTLFYHRNKVSNDESNEKVDGGRIEKFTSW